MDNDNQLQRDIIINLDSEVNLFDAITNGVVITNLDSIILYANPAMSKISGYPKDELIGKNPGIFHSGFHDQNFYASMWSEIAAKGFWEGEIWNRRKTGEIYPELLTITQINQSTSNHFYIAVCSDISFLKKDTDKKLHLAFYDPLTELPNRNLFLDRLNKNLEDKKEIAVFYMDLDKFKQVNDTFGHCVGDDLLKFVGKRLTKLSRTNDTIARIGGDEFAVILTSDCSKQAANDISRRILDSIEAPFNIDGKLINISISIGICFYPKDAKNLEELLARADKAMYKAKKTGTKIEFC